MSAVRSKIIFEIIFFKPLDYRGDRGRSPGRCREDVRGIGRPGQDWLAGLVAGWQASRQAGQAGWLAGLAGRVGWQGWQVGRLAWRAELAGRLGGQGWQADRQAGRLAGRAGRQAGRIGGQWLAGLVVWQGWLGNV